MYAYGGPVAPANPRRPQLVRGEVPSPEQYRSLSDEARQAAANLAHQRRRHQAAELRLREDIARDRLQLLEDQAAAEEALIAARTDADLARAELLSQTAAVNRLAAYYQTVYGTTPEQGAARLAAAEQDMARFNAEHPGWTPTLTRQTGPAS